MAKRVSRSMWYDQTTDPLTGHYIGKDVTKTVCFYAAVFLYLPFGMALQLLDKKPDWEPFWALLTAAGVFQGTKILDTYLNRKTRDDSGNALAQPGTTTPPAAPILMPQGSTSTPTAATADVPLPE